MPENTVYDDIRYVKSREPKWVFTHEVVIDEMRRTWMARVKILPSYSCKETTTFVLVGNGMTTIMLYISEASALKEWIAYVEKVS